MIRRIPTWAFVAAFAIQAAIVLGLVADRAWLLASGTEIRLAVVPVDPRDFFRGDYVVLSYDISSLDGSKLGITERFRYGEPIYVTLDRDGSAWNAASVHRENPGTGTVLRGTVTDADTVGCQDSQPCGRYRVDYGLEQFFVPEGEGLELETLRNDEKVSVDVAVDDGGRAALKRLRVNDAVRYEDGMF